MAGCRGIMEAARKAERRGVRVLVWEHSDSRCLGATHSAMRAGGGPHLFGRHQRGWGEVASTTPPNLCGEVQCESV